MNNQLTTERLEIMLAETLGITAARGELASIEVNASIFICVLTEALASRKAAEPVGEDELDQLIWGLEALRALSAPAGCAERAAGISGAKKRRKF